MKVAFRTESSFDNERVPNLLRELGVVYAEEVEVSDSVNPNYKIGVYSFNLPNNESFTDFRERMIELIETNKEFVDMHRCWQTVAEGEEPNEKWYLED